MFHSRFVKQIIAFKSFKVYSDKELFLKETSVKEHSLDLTWIKIKSWVNKGVSVPFMYAMTHTQTLLISV